MEEAWSRKDAPNGQGPNVDLVVIGELGVRRGVNLGREPVRSADE